MDSKSFSSRRFYYLKQLLLWKGGDIIINSDQILYIFFYPVGKYYYQSNYRLSAREGDQVNCNFAGLERIIN